MVGTESREAFVTLATNDTYSLGCLVLGSSIRRVGTTRKLVVMVSKDVSLAMRSQLLNVFDFVQEVDVLDSRDPVNLSLLGRPDLNVTFTKLHCWRLTQFDKCVFLDADALVLQNVDELFDRDELSAAPDAGWPDCFNSGVFVFKPCQAMYESLLSFATTQGSFDGGDQGLLNMFFRDWATKDISKHLPFIYNVVSQAFYSYLPAFTQFKASVKIVHFIGAVKPWHHTYNTSSRTVTPLPGTGHSQEFLQTWWNIFMSMVQPRLDPSLKVAELTQMGLCGDLASLNVQEQGAREKVNLSDAERKLNWEKGQIDYLGQDSFDNIQKKIQSSLETEKASAPPTNSSPFTPEKAPVQEKALPPAKAPVQEKVPAPVKAPVQEKAPAPTKAPAPEKAPAPVKVQSAVKVPVQVKTTTAVKAPAPAQAPAKAPAPAQTQAKAPAPAQAKAPAQAQAKAPAPTQAQAKAPAPAQAQAKAPAPTSSETAKAPQKTVMSITTTSKKK